LAGVGDLVVVGWLGSVGGGGTVDSDVVGELDSVSGLALSAPLVQPTTSTLASTSEASRLACIGAIRI
jgi:hypothetical protein